jgi:LysM repeat protein
MGPSEDSKDNDFVMSNSYRSSEMTEPRDEMNYGSGEEASGGQFFKHIYIAIAGFLILIVLAIVGIARTYSLAEKAQLLALESRLEQLESRLGSMAGEGALSQSAGSGNPLILLTERLDQLEANMTARINNVAKELQTAPAKPAPKTVQKAESTEAAPVAKKETTAKIHTVQKGDTLYHISRQYNLSIDQLRQYNKLRPKATIYPGQKLNITPPK